MVFLPPCVCLLLLPSQVLLNIQYTNSSFVFFPDIIDIIFYQKCDMDVNSISLLKTIHHLGSLHTLLSPQLRVQNNYDHKIMFKSNCTN